MFLKRSAVLLLACGALVAAGCGDDDDNGSSNDSPTAAQTTPQTAPESTPEATTPEATTTEAPSGELGDAQAKAVADACKSSLDANPQLSDGAKKDLTEACNEAGKGNVEEAKAAYKKVCIRMIEETGQSGPAVDQAKAACEAIK